MNKRTIHILYLLIITFNCLNANIQKDSVTVAIDCSKIELRQFSENLSEKYAGNDFQYDTVQGESENLLARAVNWLLKGLQNVFGIEIPPAMKLLIENIIYILLIIATIYFIIRLLAGKNALSFFGNKNKIVAPLTIHEEHIENIDLDQQIKDALAEKNYRLAIRYMYLKTLQDLSLKNLIQYHFEKTNIDYYREITDITLQQNFHKVSYLYDYIWYGEFELDEDGYNKAKKSFDQLLSNMNSRG